MPLELTLFTSDHPRSCDNDGLPVPSGIPEIVVNLRLEGGVKLHLRMGMHSYVSVCRAMLEREKQRTDMIGVDERTLLTLLQLKLSQHGLDYEVVDRLKKLNAIDDDFELTTIGEGLLNDLKGATFGK